MGPKETYLKTVYKQMQGPKKEKKMFLCGLEGDIEVFLEHNLDATYNDIEAAFGCPEDIAQEFASSLQPHIADRFLRVKKRAFIFICTIVVVTALIIISFLVVDYLEWKHFANGYYVETIIVSPDSEILPETPEESTDTILVYR